jgi:hypothetical protein
VAPHLHGNACIEGEGRGGEGRERVGSLAIIAELLSFKVLILLLLIAAL